MADKIRAALETALESLNQRCGTYADERGPGGAITLLIEALNQMDTIEPVAYLLGTKSHPDWPYHSKTLAFPDQTTQEGVKVSQMEKRTYLMGQIHEVVPLFMHPNIEEKA